MHVLVSWLFRIPVPYAPGSAGELNPEERQAVSPRLRDKSPVALEHVAAEAGGDCASQQRRDNSLASVALRDYMVLIDCAGRTAVSADTGALALADREVP